MNILTVENMTKAYGERKLFSNASFFLEEGEKAGIIGINGTGKSTLLKIIAGLEEPDEGRVIMENHCMVLRTGHSVGQDSTNMQKPKST